MLTLAQATSAALVSISVYAFFFICIIVLSIVIYGCASTLEAIAPPYT